mgnify:FL=1
MNMSKICLKNIKKNESRCFGKKTLEFIVGLILIAPFPDIFQIFR